MVASFLRQRRRVVMSVRATLALVRIASVSDGVCKRDSLRYDLALLTKPIVNALRHHHSATPHTVLTTLCLSKNMRARTRQPLRDNAV